jgi:hypothetical protein
VSETKKISNRANSKRSTGPKSDLGKTRSRLNALKLGIFATDVVITFGDLREDPEEYAILLEGLIRAWKPENVMQRLWVREIADTEWMLRRLARAEVGEIQRRSEAYWAQKVLRLGDDPTAVYKTFWSRPGSKAALGEMKESMALKSSLLAQVRENLEKLGYVPSNIQEALDSTYGGSHELATKCHHLSQLVHFRRRDEVDSLEHATEEGSGESASDEILNKMRDEILEVIKGFLSLLDLQWSELDEAVKREAQATMMAHNLPSRKFIDKLTRRETALVNRREKAIRSLLRDQGK